LEWWQVSFGNFFASATGSPDVVPGWAHILAWPLLVVAFILARPNSGR
jgi:hypothetical protein